MEVPTADGAVQAMFGKPLERRDQLTLQSVGADNAQAQAKFEALRRSFKLHFDRGDHRTSPTTWKGFWQQEVSTTWLSEKLKGKADQTGQEFTQNDVSTLQRRLRDYLRKHQVSVGPLEPWYRPGKRPGWLPWQQDGWQVCSALSPMLDVFSDVGACMSMRQDPHNAADLFIVSVVFLVASSVISIAGTIFFTLSSTEQGYPRINLRGNPKLDPKLSGDPKHAAAYKLSKEVSLAENTTKYFFLGFLPALTNPESMRLLPWCNQAAVARFGGLPSVQCVLFCTISAVLEDVPQLAVQYLYSERTVGKLQWQLQLSMGMSVLSLSFRVLLRLFIGAIELVTQHISNSETAEFQENCTTLDDIVVETGPLLPPTLKKDQGPPFKTFKNSHFKREYESTGMVPITKAAQIIGEIPEFLHTYCYVHGLTSDAEKVATEAFAERLSAEAGMHTDGAGGELTAPVQATAELLWTSAKTFEGMGEHNKEFCSLLNLAIRADHEKLAPSTAKLSRGINALCVQGRSGNALPFPKGGVVYRGGGFDDSHRSFFQVGKAFRQPCFLATSFAESKAEFFRSMAQQKGFQSILWVIQVDPDGEHDITKRCKHVNFVHHSLVPGEQEYLFTAYSIFTVRAVKWGKAGAPHRIDLDAASDNRPEAEGGSGRWATPANCEELPRAPWS